MKYLNVKDLLFTIVFTALWIGLIYKKAGLYDWIFQFDNILISYLVIAIPIIIYATTLIMSRIAKVKFLNKSND
ncbi:hypothetical protein CIB95_13395 [Lottiidibacillus patelloidae]|uniref:Uncharacterized protein n=2 Tax=Lottiidibacillus patelloidae TaxID=2670334 RepID=A0A263BRA2_9BACI|nr:hypothetical protein CIB95_13395 [Lottiidibacillus patelloidae]